MKQPVLKYNDTDFEENPYNPLLFLKYKGELFSGTMFYNDEKSYTEFRDGNAHGHSIEYYDNGQIASDCIYENEECVTEKRWHRNGQLRTDGTHLFDKNGKLIRINNSWLYPNGEKRNGEENEEYYEFSPEGQVAIKTTVNMSGDYKNTITYYDNVLFRCYPQLLTNYHPEDDQLFYNLEYKIWGWVMTKYAIDNTAGLNLLTDLGNHANNKIAETAQILIRKINTGEITAKEYIDNLSYHIIVE